MRTFLLGPACAGAVVLLVAGCATPPEIEDSTPPPGDENPPPPPPAGLPAGNLTLTGHGAFAAYNNTLTRTDRSAGPHAVTADIRRTGDVAQSFDVTVEGAMAGGTPVPNASGLVATGPSPRGGPLPEVDEVDGFFLYPSGGTYHARSSYRFRDGAGNMVHGMVVVGQPTATATMPSSGTATYNGSASINVYPDLGGSIGFLGDAELTAGFNPGSAVIEGQLKNLENPSRGLLGHDIRLNPAPIVGNTFAGTARLVTPGTTTASATTSSSFTQGSFYGTGAAEAAGIVQLTTPELSLPGGGFDGQPAPRTIIGTFGGARQ